ASYVDQVSTLGFPGPDVAASSIQPLPAAGVVMSRRTIFAALLAIGGFVSPAQAIEMFTNFNNGTELGTRPYGIEIMSPVRYHAYPRGRWFQGPANGCDNLGPPGIAPAALPATIDPDRPVRLPPTSVDGPVEIRPQPAESTTRTSAPDLEDNWIRSINFLPPAQAN
ncbi:MAG TPA: hypothetical protein VG056_01600, partial [Pirellulales bacterium]|nr:hypothetical protein [Pirellulales bacterium]